MSGDEGGPVININVVHGANNFKLLVPFHSTFEDVKYLIAQQICLDPKQQRLLFRGIERGNEEYLHTVGVKDNAKVLLMEVPAKNERQLEETNTVDVNSKVSQFLEELESMEESTRKEGKLEDEASKKISKGSLQVDEIRREIDKLAEQMAALESVIDGGTKVKEKEFIVLAELLMRQLLKLDSIEAEGDGKVQRKLEVRRVQSLVDKVDSLKVVNLNPFSNGGKAASATSTGEKCDFEMRGPSAPSPMSSSSTKVTQDWEPFE